MKIRVLLTFFCTLFLLCHSMSLEGKKILPSPSSGKSSTFLNVNHPDFPVGMFSVFCYVAGVLYEYDTHHYAGIKVDFANQGLYYDSAYGSNWWKYFCEPIHKKSKKKNLSFKTFNSEEYTHYAYFTELKLSRHEVHNLITKYIHVKAAIVEKVDRFVENFYSKSFTLGVHFRGTDKTSEAPRISYQTVANSITRYIEENNIPDYKIYVASDEQAFVDYMQETFKSNIISYEVKRAITDQPLHFTQHSSYYEMGEQALIDCLLLSKTNALIRTSSNLSLWSTYFNPDMPVMELTGRNNL